MNDPQQKRAGAVDADIVADNGRWTFGGTVAESFEAHIERSVPGYRLGHDMVARLSDYFLYDGATAIEVGCSTGALLGKLADWHKDRDLRLIGIEIEPAMARAARANLGPDARVEIVEGDALEIEIASCDLIVCYYTMQFVRPAKRQMLFDRLYASLNWGGALVMFEKVRAPDARFQDMANALYADFKLEQGLSEAEIINKTRSLKGVLDPYSTQANIDMMKRAGFDDIMTVFKQICFEGFLAIK